MVAVPSRATVHFYNSDDDIDTFVEAIWRNRGRFHPDIRPS